MGWSPEARAAAAAARRLKHRATVSHPSHVAPSSRFIPQPGTQKYANAALEAVDSVLRFPAPGAGEPPMPIRAQRSKANRGFHQERAGKLGQTVISIQPEAVHPGFTTLHEIGHHIEGKYAMSVRPEWSEVHAALRDTFAHELLREMLYGRESPSYIDPQSKRELKASLGHPRVLKAAQYLLQPNELFARGFAQYIATRSSQPLIRGEFNAKYKQQVTRELEYPSVWSHEDFAPVAAAFDDLFGALGMRHSRALKAADNH